VVAARTEVEVAKAKLLKSARAIIRLKYSLLADEELARVLPEVESQFNQSTLRGELPDAAVTASLAVVLGE
jgi:hypothetical protein